MGDYQVFFNGSIVPASQACVSIGDAGLLHGASVFTTMLARNLKVFRLEQHLARLGETVRLLNLRTDATVDMLTSAVENVLAANNLPDARMRITLTPGNMAQDKPTTIVTAEPLGDLPAHWYLKGITVVVSSFKQGRGDPAYGYKTGSYLSRVLARQEAAAKGADEALWYTHDNHLAEACFSNVFLVQDGKVFTPPRDTPVLPGIVRGAVLELCSQLGIAADDQTPLTVREMLGANEVFVTSSLSGIRPVVRVERHAVGDEKPGEITRRLMAAYQDLLDKECPAPGQSPPAATRKEPS